MELKELVWDKFNSRHIVKNIKKKIPKFKSLKEEASFWDNHDLTDYLGEMKSSTLKMSLNIPKEETLTIRLQLDFKKRLQNMAESRGVQTSTLVRMWLIEKLKSVSV